MPKNCLECVKCISDEFVTNFCRIIKHEVANGIAGAIHAKDCENFERRSDVS